MYNYWFIIYYMKSLFLPGNSHSIKFYVFELFQQSYNHQNQSYAWDLDFIDISIDFVNCHWNMFNCHIFKRIVKLFCYLSKANENVKRIFALSKSFVDLSFSFELCQNLMIIVKSHNDCQKQLLNCQKQLIKGVYLV